MYDFLLTFHSNHGPISYQFRDFSRKRKIFPPPLYFVPPLKGFPLELGTGAGGQKTRLMDFQPSGYNARKWQTDTGWQQRPYLRIMLRGKKHSTWQTCNHILAYICAECLLYHSYHFDHWTVHKKLLVERFGELAHQRVGVSATWLSATFTCRRFGMSANWSVSELVIGMLASCPGTWCTIQYIWNMGTH